MASRKIENLLPENTMETCSCFRYLLIVGRAPVTIRFLSLSVGLQKLYVTNRCRYRLMHTGFPTRLSETETQSSTSSFGPRGNTFRLDCGFTPLSLSHASPTRKTSSPVPDSVKNLMTACRKNLPHGLDIANLFPPDLRLRAWI